MGEIPCGCGLFVNERIYYAALHNNNNNKNQKIEKSPEVKNLFRLDIGLWRTIHE